MDTTKVIFAIDIINSVEDMVHSIKKQRSVVIAISGIDASGKSTLAHSICAQLQQRGCGAVVINLDHWHKPIEVRFQSGNWAQGYYDNAYRFDELFDSLILPLKHNRSIYTTIELIDAITNEVQPHIFDMQDIDVIILEGIFLFKSAYRDYYDLTYWIDCPVNVALQRAIQRNQEQLSEREIRYVYNTVYFPAQHIHLTRDDPKSLAIGIVLSAHHQL